MVITNVHNTCRRDDKGVPDVRRVVDAEADDEDDGDAGDGVDGEAPEVDDADHIDQGEGDTGQHHQANLGRRKFNFRGCLAREISYSYPSANQSNITVK